jgi:DNA-binding transcriptional LysR family regulator
MIEDIKAFLAVYDDPSLTRAADRLCLTQSAVSRRIQRLEEQLGGVLFDRSVKPLRPTTLARRIHVHARNLLSSADEFMQLAAADSEPDGTLRLGITQCVSDVALPDILSRIKTTFPALDVQLQSDWSGNLLHRTSSGQLDIAIALMRHGTTFTAPLEGRCVMSLEAVVVQSRSAPRADSRTSIAALADQDWILNSGGCGYRAALERAMANQGVGMRVFVDSQDIEGQLKLVASGLGLGLVPREFLNLSGSRDQLSIIDVFDFVLTIDVCLVYGKALGNLGKTLGTLAATLEEKFGPSLKVSTVPRTAVAG